jgi:glycolate oxidase iron-sulfur subunit
VPLKELEKIREAVVNGCMKCGFCTFFCPIYQETLDEGNVARGKIALVREVLAGNLPLTPDLLEKMDTCLLCKSCVTNCPTKVGSDRIIMAARADYVQSKGLPLTEKILFRHVLSNRPLFGRLARLGSTLKKSCPCHRPMVSSGTCPIS